MFKERIVEFSDGTYGIQTHGGWFSKPKFLWLGGASSCTQDEEYFKHCRSTNLEKVKRYFVERHVSFTPLKPPTLSEFL